MTEQTTTIAAATAGGASAWAIANDMAAALFGVPVGVLLAAAAGAFFARTFTPPSSFWQTMRGGIGWTLAGAYTLPLFLHFSGWPSTIQASAAFLLAGGLQLVAPALVPMLIKNSPVWVRGYLDRLAGVNQGGGNGDGRTS